MGTRDPRVDAYIAKAAELARPILSHLRDVVHAGCPEVEETIKWGFPHFEHKGVLCSMAAFKSHCAFGFWKGSVLAQKHPELAVSEEPAMGQLGRITALSDLPDDETLLLYVREAAALNDQGVKAPNRSKPRKDRGELEVPDDLMAALRANREALATFEGFSPSNKREYVEWVTEAKSEETRRRRLDTAVEWMAEGKVRNWKYVRK
ncbi:MAG TPA: YdeI/OmpD-associated family protein [Thermoanaerobaculia bacterium]|nr:YdeI/OmpD-associated family protein [Thermoanaerobaculia bacterium]